jgi:hypothetical protein
MLRERDAVHGAGLGDRDGLPLLLLLPLQAPRPVRAQGEALRRLLRALVLRAMRALPGVPRAPAPRLRHVHRYVILPLDCFRRRRRADQLRTVSVLGLQGGTPTW